jgi:hypothetical protein
MDFMRFKNIESSKLAADIVLDGIKKATKGILAWQHIGPHMRLAINRYTSNSNNTSDFFGVALALRMPDGRCFDCEETARTLALAVEKLSRSLREFLQK